MSLKGYHNKMVKAGLMEHSDYASTSGTMANIASISFADPAVISQNAMYIRNGSIKHHFHNQTVSTYALETKYDWQGVTGQAFGHDVTCEIEPGGSTPANRTAGGLRAVQGVARLQTGFTATGGTDIGVYGQFCNLGTVNSTGQQVGMYSLIEDGGTWTATGGLYSMWVDSHLDGVISSGSSHLLNITNNGTHVWTSGIYIGASQSTVTTGIDIAVRATQAISLSADVCTFGIKVSATIPDLLQLTAGAAGTSCVFTNVAIPAVNTSHAIRIDIGTTPHYIPVFSDLSWGS